MTYDDAFKVMVVLEALRETMPLSQLASKYEVHPNQISQWKAAFLETAPEIFRHKTASARRWSAFTEVLNKHGVKISMDGKGMALDNVFVKRLWRTVKHEDVYLHEYGSVAECRDGLTAFFDRYNNRREHQALGYRYPKDVYPESVRDVKAA
jgi:transposase InsO family protein